MASPYGNPQDPLFGASNRFSEMARQPGADIGSLMRSFQQSIGSMQSPVSPMPSPQMTSSWGPFPNTSMTGMPAPRQQRQTRTMASNQSGVGGGLFGNFAGGRFGLPAPGQSFVGQEVLTPFGVFESNNAVDWLRMMGLSTFQQDGPGSYTGNPMPIPEFLGGLENYSGYGGMDPGLAVERIGNIDAPSMQMLANMNPSELQFLAGFFETVLGIPMTDIIAGARRPFMGLGQPQMAR